MPASRGSKTGYKATCLKDIYKILEVTEAQVEALPKISHLTKPAGNTAKLIEYLRHSEEPEARAVCKTADRLIQKPRAAKFAWLEMAPIEALCASAGVAPKKLFGIIAQEVAEQSAMATALLSKAMHPKVLEKTVEMALSDEGVADRKMVHQAEQYLPMPRTSVTFAKHIDARTQTANVAILKPLEDSMKRLSDKFLEIQPATQAMESEDDS